MFTIGEELIIFSIEDGKGALTSFTSDALRFGLAGAMLADLTLQEKVILEKSKLILVDSSATGDYLLDEVMDTIAKENKPRKLTHWIERLSSKKNARRIFDQLTKKAVLRTEENRFFWVIPYEGNPMVNASAKYWLKMHLRAIVMAGEEPELRNVMLFSLIKACRLLNLIFTVDERAEAGKLVRELVKGESIGDAVAYTLRKS